MGVVLFFVSVFVWAHAQPRTFSGMIQFKPRDNLLGLDVIPILWRLSLMQRFGLRTLT